MSKRKRHSQKQTDYSHIEWLEHRKGYPTPEELKKIIQLRQELTMELLTAMVVGTKPDNAKVQSLVKKYGKEELERATRKNSETMELPAFIADDAKSYRENRQQYAHFGAGLKYYTAKEIDHLHEKTSRQSKKQAKSIKCRNLKNFCCTAGAIGRTSHHPPSQRVPRISMYHHPQYIPHQSKNYSNGVMIWLDHTHLKMKQIS